MNPSVRDVQMTDETVETGFKKASTLGNKLGREDYSFMKKKVAINIIDSEIQEYKLE